MKKLLLLIALSFGLIVSTALTRDKESDEDELLRKSLLQEPTPFNSGATSFPRNFAPLSQWQTPTNAAISTGYFWLDDREVLSPQLFPGMKPAHGRVDTNYQPEMWRKIVPGPRMLPQAYWSNNKSEGLAFFRQPFDTDFWTNPSDSTDNALAGPIPIGIRGGFYFNGLRYDSFYVSTNGVIALSNRRYFYDANGNRVIPPGATSCYDPQSMDWFAGGIRGRDTLWVRTWDNSQDSIITSGPNLGKRIPLLDGNGFVQYKNGLNDPVPDNFGYQFAALGIDPVSLAGNSATAGIRGTGGDLTSAINANCKTAIIALFWGDLILSQYDPTTKLRDEHGYVFYKRTYTNDSLIIAFYRAQPKGTIATPFGTVNIDPNTRPYSTNYVTGDAHVVLSAVDSSITMHYTRISDRVTTLGRPVPGGEVFKYNTTCGVRGFARHVNFGKGGLIAGQPWGGEYIQATTYFQKYAVYNPSIEYPYTGTTVKFKQWQNTLRVHEITYRVRSKDPKADNPTDFVTELKADEVVDYELLAGHERLGAIQPVALIQNLTNEIQGPGGPTYGPAGVNFVKQALTFRGRFQIRNTITNRVIYNRLVPVDALCMGLADTPEDAQKCMGDPTVRVRLANFNGTTLNVINNFQATGFNGVPPYYFVRIVFPPFEPNEFIDNHIGRMRSFVIAEPVNPATGEKLRDNWPFDDSSKITLFVMRRYYDEHPKSDFRQFEDDGSQWHIDLESGDNIPSAWKWVNINAQMVSGDAVSKYPLSPRKLDTAHNYFLGAMNNIVTLRSPVIKMNRLQIDDLSEPLAKYQDNRSPKRGGDEIRSFPIDLRAKQNPILTLSIQRVIHKEDWARDYSEEVLVGPEPRVTVSGQALATYTNGNAASAVPDEIVVEFAKPSDDEIDRITNIKLDDWRHLPYRRGVKDAALTTQAPLTLFGAGGYMIAFLETNKDSTLALPGTPTGAINSLRYNMFDDGIDWEYKKFALPIPDTFVLWKNQGAKYFRFRVKVYATNDQKCQTCIGDDADDFFVDNVKILYRAEVTDIEVSSVKVSWPYTIVPASQATSIPITVRVSNNTDIDAPNFSIKVKIFRTNSFGDILDKDPIYCRTQNISNLVRRGSLDQLMPPWNARKSLRDTVAYFKLFANIMMSERDLVPKNDTTYSDFVLRVGRVFAYDPPEETPTNSLGASGLNLLLPQLASGQPRSGPTWDGTFDTRGAVGGSGSGAVAIKFNLLNSDTLRGYSVLWGPLNRAADQISMSLFEGGDRLPSTTNRLYSEITTRGGKNFANIYGRYVDYIFPEPKVLAKGTYWIGISQDGETGMELGVSKSRSGQRTTNTYVSPAGIWGEAGTSLNIDKNFRKMQSGNLVNDNFFAMQNVSGSLEWLEFSPTSGNPAYGNLNHYGAPVDPQTQTLTRGSWIPMVRPYFGPKGFGESVDVFEWCPDDIPVELYTFTGSVRPSGIDLFWETGSEINNYGFFVERRNANTEEEFKQVGFVSGAGNSSTISRYNFLDKDVKVKHSYDYRLRQVDKDGSQECYTSNIVTLTFDKIGDLVLEQNSPNPFVNTTLISFNVPKSQDIKLEVVDLFGNVVRVLANESLPAQRHSYIFDGTDNSGNALPSGSYIYRLSSENEVLTGKMSIVR
jgi:hypothetical protein